MVLGKLCAHTRVQVVVWSSSKDTASQHRLSKAGNKSEQFVAVQVTFADQLGAAKHNEGEVDSKNEAKKLAFYLFWNIKPYFDRYASPQQFQCS